MINSLIIECRMNLDIISISVRMLNFLTVTLKEFKIKGIYTLPTITPQLTRRIWDRCDWRSLFKDQTCLVSARTEMKYLNGKKKATTPARTGANESPRECYLWEINMCEISFCVMSISRSSVTSSQLSS